MGTHTHDHELKIDSTTKQLCLMRDSTGAAMYQAPEDIPAYQNPIEFVQTDWTGGHGQFEALDKTMFFEGQNIDTTQKGRVLLGPLITGVEENDGTALDDTIVCFSFLPSNSYLLCATRGKVYRMAAGASAWTATLTAGTLIRDIKVFNNFAYVALGSSTKYYYSSDGLTWTQTDLTDGYANGFLVASNPAGTADILWKWKTPNEVSSTTDGRTVAAGGVQWSSPAYIGDTSANVTNMFVSGDTLLIGRDDGKIYHYDENGGIHLVTDTPEIGRSSSDFQYLTTYKGDLYASLRADVILRISSYNTISFIGPWYEREDMGKRQRVCGLAADRDWLYVGTYDETATTSYIYKVGQDENGKWQWCPWVYTTSIPNALYLSQQSESDGYKRLYFGGSVSDSKSTSYVILTENPTVDTTARFASSGWIRMSYTYGDNPYWDKMWQSIITETKSCATGISVTPWYRKDTDTSATQLAATLTSNGVIKTNLTTALTSKRMQFQFNLATNDSTKTPEVSLFQARGIEKPERIRVHECVYTVADEPSTRVKTIKDFLETGRTTTSLIRFADLRYGQNTASSAGNYVWVIMQPGYPQPIEVVHEKNRQPELGIKCRFQEVSFTIS